jgi:2-polyprenyl-6-methoxyphenol hydroxylase-like FAD-dependent oxidoreductase
VRDAGLRLIYGRIPLHHRNALPAWVFERVFTVVGGPGAHVGVGPVILRNRPTGRLTPVDDYVACMVGAPSDRLPAELRGLDGPELHRLATSLIGQEWHRDLRCLLDRWDTESLFPLRIASAAAVENWSTPGVTLLGDAVHAMSPTLAMGANTALRDGGELSYAIATSGTLREAATVYQARMLSYAMSLVQESRRIGRSRIGQR